MTKKTTVRPRKALRSRLRMAQIELPAAMQRSPTLSAAARDLNLTQPAASRLVNALAVRDGRIDLLVGRFETESPFPDLVIERLNNPSVKFVCGAQHPLARRRSVTRREPLQEGWILPEGGTPMRNAIETFFRKSGMRPRSSGDRIAVCHKWASKLLAMRSFASLRLTRSVRGLSEGGENHDHSAMARCL